MYVKVTWLNPAGGQFDIKWDVAMCSQHHGTTNGNSSGGNHLQSMLTIVWKITTLHSHLFLSFVSTYHSISAPCVESHFAV